jgi:hypothetical protein
MVVLAPRGFKGYAVVVSGVVLVGVFVFFNPAPAAGRLTVLRAEDVGSPVNASDLVRVFDRLRG